MQSLDALIPCKPQNNSKSKIKGRAHALLDLSSTCKHREMMLIRRHRHMPARLSRPHLCSAAQRSRLPAELIVPGAPRCNLHSSTVT